MFTAVQMIAFRVSSTQTFLITAIRMNMMMMRMMIMMTMNMMIITVHLQLAPGPWTSALSDAIIMATEVLECFVNHHHPSHHCHHHLHNFHHHHHLRFHCHSHHCDQQLMFYKFAATKQLVGVQRKPWHNVESKGKYFKPRDISGSERTQKIFQAKRYICKSCESAQW